MSAKRDEFSCPCCGTPTDSAYCAPCATAGCGEQDYRDASGLCVAELFANGWSAAGTSVERVQLKGGELALCRIENLRRPDGTFTYGRIMEVITPAFDEVSR